VDGLVGDGGVVALEVQPEERGDFAVGVLREVDEHFGGVGFAIRHREVQADLATDGGAVQRVVAFLQHLVGGLVRPRRQRSVEVVGEPFEQFGAALGEPLVGSRNSFPVKAFERLRHGVWQHQAVVVQRAVCHDVLLEFRSPRLRCVFAPLL